MSTPAYVPPYVGPAGLVTNSYAAILADNLAAVQNIFGQSQYLGVDNWLYQLISILSLKQSDQNQALQLAYNQSTPQTAVGAGLDRVVKMNGLARAAFTYSTALLTLTGTPGAVIINGAAQDQNGNVWTLPSPLTLVGGTATALATCTTPGNVAAAPGTINIINTPTVGWAPPLGTVTNASAATQGNAVEADSSLRARQSVSVALPGLTPVASTLAALLAVPGVTRLAPGYPTPGGPGTSVENPTGSADSWGNPAHSISMTVEGGSDSAIALAIYLARTLGCYTNGTTAVQVADPVTGFLNTMRFYRPTYAPVFVLATLTGYGAVPTSATLAAVQAALVAYLNELQIGETVSYAALVYEAMAVNASLTQPGFGLTLLLGLLTAATTATLTLGSPNITVASGTGIVVGQLAVGPGIPAGATVTAVSGTAVTLSANATAAGTGVAVSFATLAASDIAMPTYYTVAEGVAANVSVVAA